MKHLSQQMLSPELRRPHLKKYRRALQKRLRGHGLDADSRRALEREIHGLGAPKVYSADDPPPPGAIHPGVVLAEHLVFPPDSTYDQLSATPHTRLYLYAIQQDLDVHPGNTKAQLVNAILSHLREEQGVTQ